MKKRVAVGLSGGVDSAVSAAILKGQGYDVTGVFIICYWGPGCRTDEDRKDALDVALKLGIPFKVLDFRKKYQEKVLEYFKAEYTAGRTPNPDVVCNREIKFGLFYKWAMKQGYDFVATGHYARVQSTRETRNQKPKTRTHLLRGVDKKKDQSYFLYQLREEQLPHTLFPVGGMTKAEVRAEAHKRQLPVAQKPDSQGICFIGEVSIPQFLKNMGLKEKVGKVVIQNPKSKIQNPIGIHQGVWFYTIGQRVGSGQWTVNSEQIEHLNNLRQAGLDPSNLPPLYVMEKDVAKNRLVVGKRDECMKKEFTVGEVHWVNQSPVTSHQSPVFVRIRHQGELIPAKIQILKSKILVHLGEPAFGIAPGQSAVFYQGNICIGGGIIA